MNPSYQILVGDVLTRLREMPDESVNCVVTSPPYWGLRDYGVAGQIGLEKTPQELIAKLTEVFREVRRVLRTDGTCWVNMGDSYSHGGNGSRDPEKWPKQSRNDHRVEHAKADSGVKPKDLMGMPWRLAFALQEDGWWLRQDIIWSKPNPMPESVSDRCTKAHEYLFLLTKSARYFYDAEAIKEPVIADHPAGNKSHKGAAAYLEGDERRRTKLGLVAYAQRKTKMPDVWDTGRGAGWREDPANSPETRNKRSVWEIATQPFAEAHFATFPRKLVEPCIRAGCPAGGVVLDPFNGSGTTGLVAMAERCSYIGIELNPEYAAMAERRLLAATAQEVMSFA